MTLMRSARALSHGPVSPDRIASRASTSSLRYHRTQPEDVGSARQGMFCEADVDDPTPVNPSNWRLHPFILQRYPAGLRPNIVIESLSVTRLAATI